MVDESWQPEPRPRKLRRSSRERMWAGVAGGLGEYFDVDPVLVRLIWVVGTVVTAGLFVAVYIVLWVIMPSDTDLPASERRMPDAQPVSSTEAGEEPGQRSWRRDYSYTYRYPYGDYSYTYRYRGGRHRRSAGMVLIALGLLFLASQAGLFRWINWSVAWAVVLIVLGVALLMRRADWRS